MTDLIDCIAYIQQARKNLPAGGADQYEARRKAVEDVAQAIVRDLPKAKITNGWNGAKVSILGVRASSTGGIDGALANWVTAARRRLDQTGFISATADKEDVR